MHVLGRGFLSGSVHVECVAFLKELQSGIIPGGLDTQTSRSPLQRGGGGRGGLWLL